MQRVNLEDVAIVGRPNSDNVAMITADLLEQGNHARFGLRKFFRL
jgi:hypothetical protein